jgi:hypothetical protein
LTPGGVFKFQVQGAEPAPGDQLDTWRGAYLSPEDAVRIADQTGCGVVDFEGLGEQYFWLWFRKSDTQQTPDRSHDLLAAEAARRRTVARRIEEELRERTAWAQSLDARIQELDQAIVRLQQELETSNSWALGLDTENKSLRALIEERTAWAQERDDRVRNLEDDIRRLQGELDERTVWARDLERQVEERTAWARRLEAELDQHRGWLAAIEQSFAYRLAVRLRLSPKRGGRAAERT